SIYSELFPLVRAGGCFLNFEILTHPLGSHLEWLRESGFENVERFWTGEEHREHCSADSNGEPTHETADRIKHSMSSRMLFNADWWISAACAFPARTIC